MNSNYFNILTDSERFVNSLKSFLKKRGQRPLVILCIGTDKCSGDSLGPLIGYKLEKQVVRYTPSVYIYGTLSAPVHALNLWETIITIYQKLPQAYIVAIDASLGQADHVGMVTLADGPLVPGLGANKQLPQIGDIHITGIVNTRTSNCSSTLQTTRLNTVMALADFICQGIGCSIESNKKRFLA